MRISTATLTTVAAFAAAIALSAQAQQAPAQTPPAGPSGIDARSAIISSGVNVRICPAGDLAIRVCAQCHEPNRAAALRLTRDGWEGVVQKMRGLGAQGTDADFGQITDYLAENFKGEAQKPINMNTASSIDLEAVAGLLRKEAAIWIAYRNKNGPCKSLDDLKKVAGLPFKKIDDRRDRLVCF